MATIDEKQEKGARNQALFRAVNERIGELTDTQGASPSERWDFLCECANSDCFATVRLSVAEYESVRRIPTHFPLAPGHDDPEIERVVEENERFIVVEKFGEGGMIAVRTDPRRDTAKTF